MAFVAPLPLARVPAAPSSAPQRFVIRAAKHVQFKGAKKHDRCRPKKHRPSDINRAPPSFNPEPLRVEGLPPVLEVFKPDQVDDAFQGKTTLMDAAMVDEYEKSFSIEEYEKSFTEAETEPAVAEPAVAESSSE